MIWLMLFKSNTTKSVNTKVEFLNLGFKGYTAFRNVCKDLGKFSNMELFLFWDHNVYSYATYLKINKVLDKLKEE